MLRLQGVNKTPTQAQSEANLIKYNHVTLLLFETSFETVFTHTRRTLPIFLFVQIV
jgi:hypothetical protein